MPVQLSSIELRRSARVFKQSSQGRRQRRLLPVDPIEKPRLKAWFKSIVYRCHVTRCYEY